MYHAETGDFLHKILLKYPNFKEVAMVVALPDKPWQVALIDLGWRIIPRINRQSKCFRSYHLVKEWLRAKFKGWTVARSKHHSQDKGNVMDVKNKKFVRSIPQWGGRTSKDGR